MLTVSDVVLTLVRAARVDPNGLPDARAYHRKAGRTTRARMQALEALAAYLGQPFAGRSLSAWLASPAGTMTLPIGSDPRKVVQVGRDGVTCRAGASAVELWKAFGKYVALHALVKRWAS